ncbi:Metallo-dependent phosphatase-like protein [Aspergillus pseudotamarii]|uniref:Metallo-dependent phosphatase-like protein n=1 Tax=Aspergillus pseudotamarii TaxID=132259 RepID=A0A5N6TAW1_ASPPS|nr:Metallo-dependent phosphatase-like protein [Aspergillus pseudotamarii]KAE8143410.1 Metallo-dependent phosphatase-like protein [Aspergillus pseudotamarii]
MERDDVPETKAFFQKPSASFQVLSDLHLEINQQYSSFEIPVCAKYLILAGDIGRLVDYDNYRDFIQKQTDRFELVFLTLGNHEFYNGSFAEGLDKAKQLEREPSLKGRLVLLHQRRYTIPGSRVTILGCTLWSHVPPDSRVIVQSKIQDFQKIKNWTIDDHNARHESDLAWLLNEIRTADAPETRAQKQQQQQSGLVVVTHHAPSRQKTSSPQHAQNAWSSAFGTDILSNGLLDGVRTWVFGHTHYTTDFREGGIRVVSNQRGYVLPWSKMDGKDGFDVGKVIRV